MLPLLLGYLPVCVDIEDRCDRKRWQPGWRRTSFHIDSPWILRTLQTCTLICMRWNIFLVCYNGQFPNYQSWSYIYIQHAITFFSDVLHTTVFQLSIMIILTFIMKFDRTKYDCCQNLMNAMLHQWLRDFII